MLLLNGHAAEPCATVESVISADPFRGYHASPYRTHLQASWSHAELEMDAAESHGASYLRCRYRVTVDKVPYRYDLVRDTTLERLEVAWCQTEAARTEAARVITERTDGCTDLEGGWFYYGVKLEPLEK